MLFAVEPMAAKQLLPALGGSSAVWITCLVFFQTALLLGYLYAHWLGRRSSARAMAIVHLALLVVAAVLLVVVVRPDTSGASSHPQTAIFEVLIVTIGLPFMLLASTSPLLQLWLAREEHSGVPWKLFALSNAGSLLALVLYPTVIEPHLSLGVQRKAWGCGFGLYVIVCAAIAWRARRMKAVPEAGASQEPRSSARAKMLWFLLPAGGAIQLCAVTSHLSQNIAAIPLLWVLPLGVYLLTFIIAFEAPPLRYRWIIARLLVVLLASLAWMLSKTDVTIPIQINIGFFLAELFFACLFCHVETYALRQENPSESTLFYLLIAAGGAAGTIFIGIICPMVFDANYDVALAFLTTAALATIVMWDKGWAQRLLWGTGTAGEGIACAAGCGDGAHADARHDRARYAMVRAAVPQDSDNVLRDGLRSRAGAALLLWRQGAQCGRRRAGSGYAGRVWQAGRSDAVLRDQPAGTADCGKLIYLPA